MRLVSTCNLLHHIFCVNANENYFYGQDEGSDRADLDTSLDMYVFFFFDKSILMCCA